MKTLVLKCDNFEKKIDRIDLFDRINFRHELDGRSLGLDSSDLDKIAFSSLITTHIIDGKDEIASKRIISHEEEQENYQLFAYFSSMIVHVDFAKANIIRDLFVEILTIEDLSKKTGVFIENQEVTIFIGLVYNYGKYRPTNTVYPDLMTHFGKLPERNYPIYIAKKTLLLKELER